MLRNLENPGFIRILVLLVVVLVAAVVMVDQAPAILHSDLHTGVQSFLH